MSKKDKLKFKKRIHAQLFEEMAKSGSQPKIKTHAVPQIQFPPPIESPTSKDQVQTKADVIISKEPTEIQNNLRYVKSDLKKSAIIIGSIIAIIVALYFIDNKTNILITISDKIFRATNIII